MQQQSHMNPMESEPLLRRRTPLSDRTNTTTSSTALAAATTTRRRQFKPLKPYTAATTMTTKTRSTTNTCSTKSNSSIGSNLPETTVLDSGGRACWRSAVAAPQDETIVSERRWCKQKASPEDLLFADRFHLRPTLGLPIGSSPSSGAVTLKRAMNTDSLDETQFSLTRKDKGNVVLRDPSIDSSNLSAASLLRVPVSSSFGDGKPVAHATSDETPVVKTRKDKQNAIPEDTSIESFSSDFGAKVGENVEFQTTWNPRSIQKIISTNERSTGALFYSHGKRSREAWFKVGAGVRDFKSGSFSDPLPAHMKKRQHSKPVYSMNPDEAEKLRAYYAEIDAFELPEESESE